MEQGTFALGITLAIYAALAASFLGWGRIAVRCVGIAPSDRAWSCDSIWLGWATFVFVLQLAHFVFAIRADVVVPILGLGIAASIPALYRAFRDADRQPAARTWRIGATSAMLVLACWLAERAMLPPTNYDAGLYHLSAIRWSTSYPVVPGLGNLHDRLGLNQSFFTYVAALNFEPWFGFGRCIANSFLFLLMIATTLPSLRTLTTHSTAFAGAPIRCWADVLILPILVYVGLTTEGLSSPSPDLTSVLIQLALLRLLLMLLAPSQANAGEREQHLLLLAVLCATAVTVKLSNVMVGATIMVLATAGLAPRASWSRLVVIRSWLAGGAIVAVWIAVGYVTSGAPLFPSRIGHVSADWAVPKGVAENIMNWTYSWARAPHKHPHEVLGNWNWLPAWREHVVAQLELIVFPIAWSLACLFAALSVSVARAMLRLPRQAFSEYLLLLPWLAGIGFWFVTAPDPRFANATFWALAISSTVLLLSSLRSALARNGFAAAAAVIVLAASLPFIRFAAFDRQHRGVRDVSTQGWHASPVADLVTRTTRSGLVVHVPARDSDQTWDAPLPATPYFNPALRLRVAGRMASGFTVQPE